MINSIPQDIKLKIKDIVKQFNEKQFSEKKLNYNIEVEGPYIYFKVAYDGQLTPILRAIYTGDEKTWKFEIFQSASGKYVSTEEDFPGRKYLDGSFEGAMKAGIETYYA